MELTFKVPGSKLHLSLTFSYHPDATQAAEDLANTLGYTVVTNTEVLGVPMGEYDAYVKKTLDNKADELAGVLCDKVLRLAEGLDQHPPASAAGLAAPGP